MPFEPPIDRSPTDVPLGLNAPLQRKIKLVFHVIVPTAYWDWSGQSRLRIRFNDKNLGDWSDVGDFHTVM